MHIKAKFIKIRKNNNLNKYTIKGHKGKGGISLLGKSPLICVTILNFYPPVTVITGNSLYMCTIIQVRSKSIV
jgi:hypothetical protein